MSRPSKEQIVSMLHQIKSMPNLPELSGDSLYWALAMEGLKIVPDLIDIIDDTTETDINIQNRDGYYTIGDISLSILQEIIYDLPILSIIDSKKGYDGPLNYYEFARYGVENRNYLKTALHYWFAGNREKLIWIADTTNFGRGFDDWGFETYYLPAKGYYRLKFEITPCEHNAASQPGKERIISMLRQIKDMPYLPELSGDSLYWALAMEGLEIVPDLIDIIDDTTETDMSVPNWGGQYAIGDISFSILQEIIYGLPIMEIIRDKKDYPRDMEMGLSYYVFVRYNTENRNYLKTNLHCWFAENKEKLIWASDTANYGRAAEDWKYGTYQLPTKGQYCINGQPKCFGLLQKNKLTQLILQKRNECGSENNE
jgi:hypothetical protein